METYERLEQEFAEWNKLDPAGMVACSSGTAALHLALEALQLPQGSEVICPDYTMVACARAITLSDLKPRFIDCEERLLINPEKVQSAVEDAYDGVGNSNWKPGRRVSAVMPVNIYGREYDVFGVRKATESYGIKVIEDLAESHGIKPSYNADAACWSFYKNKIIAGEEGGAVWFKDPEHAKLARSLRSLGFNETHDFRHIPRGHNYRLSNTHASLVLQSLRMVDHNLEARRVIEALYNTHCPLEWRMPERDVPWVYDIRIPGLHRDGMRGLVKGLNFKGIAARMGFLPMTGQREYRPPITTRLGVPESTNTDLAGQEVFYLPIQPGITSEVEIRGSFRILRECITANPHAYLLQS